MEYFLIKVTALQLATSLLYNVLTPSCVNLFITAFALENFGVTSLHFLMYYLFKLDKSRHIALFEVSFFSTYYVNIFPYFSYLHIISYISYFHIVFPYLFHRFCLVEKDGVTSNCLSRDSLNVSCLVQINIFVNSLGTK